MNEKMLRDYFQRVKMVALAMAIGVGLMYLIMIFILPSRPPTIMENSLWLIRIALGAMLLVHAAFGKSLLYKNLGYDGERLIARITMNEFCRKLLILAMLSIVFAELPAIFGLILYVQGHSWVDLLLGLGGFAVLSFINFPRYSQWQEQFERNRDLIES